MGRMLAIWKKLPAKYRKWCLWAVIAVAAYTVIGFLLLPPVIKWQLEKQLPTITKRIAKVRQVRTNPWTLSLTIRGLQLLEPDGSRFASWEEFYANFQLSSLFRWAWTFDEIHLNEPYGHILLQTNGVFNFANMFEKSQSSAEKKTDKAVPRTCVFLLSITNGCVELADLTRRKPFSTVYTPINILVTELRTKPGAETPYSFKARNDTGKSIAWNGDVTVQPFASRGSLDVRGADPKKYQPYLDDFTRAEVMEGKVNLRIDYYFAAGTNGTDLIVSNAVVQVNNLKIRDPATAEDVFSMPRLSLERGAFHLQKHMGHAKLLKVEGVELLTRLDKSGTLNLLDLMLPPPTNHVASTNKPARNAAASPSPPWIFALDQLQVVDASVSFEDLARKIPFQTRLSPITVTVDQFTTAPARDAKFQFSVPTEANETLAGEGTFSVNPLRSSGGVKVSAVTLKKYWPYAEPFLNGAIQDGKVDAQLRYGAALTSNSLEATVSDLAVQVSNLRLAAAETNETVVTIPQFAIEAGDASLVARTGTVKLVKTTQGSLVVRRDADDKINLLKLLKPPAPSSGESHSNSAAATASAPAGLASPWVVNVEEVAVEGFQFQVEDKVPEGAPPILLDQVALSVRGLSTATNTPLTAKASLRVNESGTVEANARGRLQPPTAEVELTITNFDVRLAQPYLKERALLQLASGVLGIRGKAVWQPDDPSAPRLRFQGDAALSGIHTADLRAFNEFVSWTNLLVNGIDYAMQPDRLQVASIFWDGLRTSILVDTNRHLNLLTIIPTATNGAARPSTATTNASGITNRALISGIKAPFPVSLTAFTLRNAGFHFTDASIQPNCRFNIQQLGGTITNLSSEAGAVAGVSISGHFDEQSPFALEGNLSPFSEDFPLNLTFSNRNMQLPAFTPYMEKYVGYPLNRGKLSLVLAYEIKNKEVKAENKFIIDQFMLGARNESPDATKLPLKLAIALLKDRNGKIDLDVPVTGRIDDPQFRIAPIIGKVIMNLITKAATSPFKLFGALVGGGEELSFVEFEAGTTQFLAGETNKFGKLVKALEQRPAINIEIEASADPDLDRQELARQILRARLKTERLQELAATGQTPSDPEEFQVEPAEYERLLRGALAKQFGTNLTQALKDFAVAATNAAAKTADQAKRQAAEKPKRGLLRQVVSWVPLHSKNSPAGQARHRARVDAELLKQNPELATLQPADMEILLASKVEVPVEAFRKLLEERAQAVQTELLRGGTVTSERVFLTPPKEKLPDPAGSARAVLSLN